MQISREKLNFLSMEELVKQLKDRQKIPKEQMAELILKVSQLIKNEPNILKLTSPINIVGDIHGQFYDLLNIFRIYNSPPNKQYLFLGDFIDRGTFSIEVITLLFAYKLKYPQLVHLIRGNHESRCMTAYFNFRQECLAKYSEDIYQLIMKLFDELPLCAIIDHQYFAVHAGISPSCHTISDIIKINRFQQVPESGGMCDLLWSDPTDQVSANWEQNQNRNCSYYFGVNQAKSFLNKNKLKMIIRGHQVQQQGFKYQKFLDVSFTLTIFSAPNYSNQNKACICQIQEGKLQIKIFTAVESPVFLPNFLNLFEWSVPFIAQCTNRLFKHLLKLTSQSKNQHQQRVDSTSRQQDFWDLRKNILLDQILRIGANIQSQKKQQFPTNFSIQNSMDCKERVIGPKLQKMHKTMQKIDLIDSDDKDLIQC